MFDLHAAWRWLVGGDREPASFELSTADADGDELEQPWLYSWEHLPKRTAGSDFSRADYRAARKRAIEVARTTLGDEAWSDLQRDGYLELSSSPGGFVGYIPIEVRADPGYRVPWVYPYLCINPTYPLPEVEFFAQLYLYVRDREEEIVRVAAPQPWDQTLGRTF